MQLGSPTFSHPYEDGDVIDILVQSRRHRRAARRFFRTLLEHPGREPQRLITDKLRRYAAAYRVGSGVGDERPGGA